MAKIVGAHAVLYSTDPDADRGFLRDVLKLAHVDVGGGWLIFGLPPAEVAVHPAHENGVHELYLMCDNVERFLEDMRSSNIACEPVTAQTWGLLTHVILPGGGKLGVYEPRHARPGAPQPSRRSRATRRASGASRKGPSKQRKSR